jgi:sortase A
MRLKLIALGLIGSLFGGSCALVTILLVVLAHWWQFRPIEPLGPRENVVLSSWVTPTPIPVIVATIPPVMVETPLPLNGAPLVETPQALLPTVTPEPTPLSPVVTSIEQPPPQVIPTAPSLPVAPAGIATRLMIPAIGLDTPIVLAPRQGDTWDVDHLGQIAGHLEGTAPPGSGGNIVLAGHYTLVETHGGPGPFYKLKHLVPGDMVTIYQGEISFQYVIDGFQTVDEKAVEVTFSTGIPQLTLLTCIQWNRSQGEYVKRLIVKGHLF